MAYGFVLKLSVCGMAILRVFTKLSVFTKQYTLTYCNCVPCFGIVSYPAKFMSLKKPSADPDETPC